MALGETFTEAFILIEVPAKYSGNIAKRLVEELGNHVIEAHAVWGESDVIARVAVPNTRVLAQIVMEKVQTMSEVRSTRTYIIIDGMSVYSKNARPERFVGEQ